MERNKITPVIIILFLLILALGSVGMLLLPQEKETKYIADLYQNGILLQSIPLYAQEEAYTFVIHGENGCTNTVEVKPGSIAVIFADCPDQICVKQGHIHNSILPITCLPNRLVIQLRPAEDDFSRPDTSITPDIITY